MTSNASRPLQRSKSFLENCKYVVKNLRIFIMGSRPAKGQANSDLDVCVVVLWPMEDLPRRLRPRRRPLLEFYQAAPFQDSSKTE